MNPESGGSRPARRREGLEPQDWVRPAAASVGRSPRAPLRAPRNGVMGNLYGWRDLAPQPAPTRSWTMAPYTSSGCSIGPLDVGPCASRWLSGLGRHPDYVAPPLLTACDSSGGVLAVWEHDPEADLSPQRTSVDLLVREVECASGRSVEPPCRRGLGCGGAGGSTPRCDGAGTRTATAAGVAAPPTH